MLTYQENHDNLTGLPNRFYLETYLKDAIQTANQTNTNLAVVSMDIDRFKDINDIKGHSLGDDVLKEVSSRLKEILGNGVFLARLGGDEFFMVLENLIDESSIKSVISKIIHSFETPFIIKEEPYYLSMSIGISVYREHSETVENLISDAEMAMYQSKKSGTRFKFFQSEMRKYTDKHFYIESQLRQALENKEIDLYFQPKYSLTTGLITGAEALVRLSNNKRMSPADFIPIAENTGLIHVLGEIVLVKACEEVRKWNGISPYPLRVAINFSARQFQQPGITKKILQIIKGYNVPTSWIEIEITESLLLSKEAVNELRTLKKLGFHIAVDDFGTGYSSLSYIKGLPIQTLKIDKSFINDIQEDGSNSEITSIILKLAQKLGLNVVAEGVEKIYQLEYLKKQGCQEVQGYLLGKPMMAIDFLAVINKSGAFGYNKQSM